MPVSTCELSYVLCMLGLAGRWLPGWQNLMSTADTSKMKAAATQDCYLRDTLVMHTSGSPASF